MSNQKRMTRAVGYMIEFMRTYPSQTNYKDYSDKTYIDDVLYGLGASLDEKYETAQGFDKFKEVLRDHLKKGETD